MISSLGDARVSSLNPTPKLQTGCLTGNFIHDLSIIRQVFRKINSSSPQENWSSEKYPENVSQHFFTRKKFVHKRAIVSDKRKRMKYWILFLFLWEIQEQIPYSFTNNWNFLWKLSENFWLEYKMKNLCKLIYIIYKFGTPEDSNLDGCWLTLQTYSNQTCVHATRRRSYPSS